MRTRNTSQQNCNYRKERRRTHKRPRRDSAVFSQNGLESMPGAWLLVGVNERQIIAASRLAAQTLEQPRQDLIGKCLDSLQPVSSGGAWPLRHMGAIPLQSEGRYEDVWVSKGDGSILIAEVHVSHVKNHLGGHRSLILLSDTTVKHQLQTELITKHQDLRKAHEELKTHAEKIEKAQTMLEQLNTELSTTSAKLGRASQLAVIGQITAEMAHQINNPLAAAMSACQFLDEALSDQADEDLNDIFDILKLSLDRLNQTILELKRVYRNAKPDSNVVLFDLGMQVEVALALLKHRIEETNISVKVDVHQNLPKVVGRPAHVQHTIINLLDNALNAVGQHGRIIISARASQENVRLVVGDSGPGIPVELREKVMEPFFTTREQGTGLGLSLVQRYLTMEGATLRINNSPLGGAEFRVDFPLQHSVVPLGSRA